MKKITLVSILSILVLSGCGAKESSSKETSTTKEITQVDLVLDYVPNTNHSGIYVALEKGYYEAENLKVNLIEPGDDSTSISIVGAGKAQLGISYQEDLTYAKTNGNEIPVKAIATIVKHNTSGFVSAKNSGIKSPADFEGKVYAGWQTPGEEALLQAVMNDAKADFTKLTMVGSPGTGPEALGKDYDLQWYFEGWDMVKASQAGIEVNYLPLRELDERLDYYTPLFFGNQKFLTEQPEVAKAFLKATKKGYQDAMAEPEATAKLIHQSMPEYELDFLQASQAFLSKNYTDEPEKWGLMDAAVWDNYMDFMFEYELIDEKVASDTLFTNDFIE